MSESIRPNYFILLGIDPEEPWSEVEFAKILTTRKAEWTKLRNHPTKKGEAQKKLELVPKIESLMKNESERKKEATDAINLKSEQQKGVRESFIQSFELFTTKGFITEEEILQLVNQYSSITSDANLREDIKSKGIEIKETIIDSSENEEVLPLSLMKDIKTNLEILNQKNVYDFLELAKSSRTKDLELKAKKIYAEVQKYGDKNTDINMLYGPIIFACINYLMEPCRNEFIELFKYASIGLSKLKETYLGRDITYNIDQIKNIIDSFTQNKDIDPSNFVANYQSQIYRLKTDIYKHIGTVWDDDKHKIMINLINELINSNDNIRDNIILSINSYLDHIDIKVSEIIKGL